MGIFLTITSILILGVASAIIVFKSSGFRIAALLGLLVKITSGILLGWLYMEYYGYGDTLSYFNEGVRMANLFLETPSGYVNYLINSHSELFTSQFVNQPRALFYSKITSVFCLITYNNYWLIACYFSIISFFGAWYLAKTLLTHFLLHRRAIILSLFFLPSAVFWSSGIIKESLCFFSILFLSALIIKWVKTQKWTVYEAVIFVLGALLLWKIKYYYAGVFISISFTILLTTYLLRNHTWVNKSKLNLTGTYFIIFITLTVCVSLLHPNLGMTEIHHVVVKNYTAFAEKSQSGQFIVFNDMDNFYSLIINTPKAFISGMFRPFLWEVKSNTLLIAYSLESTFFMCLLIARLIYLPRNISKINYILIFSCILFIGVMITFLAFSAPNYGTLSRYKSSIIPFFGLLLLIDNPLIEKLKLNTFWRRAVKD